jgi:hypothetical protein
MIPSQDPPPSRRGRALAIAILGFAAVCLAIFGLPAFPKNDFKSKFNRIQLDMSEDEVDHLLDGYPVYREELMEVVREAYGPPDGPCKRTPLFRKTYSEPGASEARDYLIEVYFDQDYLVVDKILSQYIK